MVAFRLIRLLGVTLLLLAAIIALPTAVAREASSPALRALSTTAPQASLQSALPLHSIAPTDGVAEQAQLMARDTRAAPNSHGEADDALLLVALAAMLALAGEILLRTFGDLRRL